MTETPPGSVVGRLHRARSELSELLRANTCDPARGAGARAAALVLALVALGCGSSGDDDPPEGPPTVDERAGTYRGVGLRSTLADARTRLGTAREGPSEPLAPLGDRPLETGVPTGPRNPKGMGPQTVWRFREAAMVADRGRAWLAVFTAKDARTTAGVGVGSTLDEARRAYPGSYCATANEGTGYVTFPFCTVRVAAGRHLWFAHDPVGVVGVSFAPMACPPKGSRTPIKGCPE